MAVPKKRQSRSRSRKRRAQHDRMTPPTTAWCPNCKRARLPHHMCPSCGFYKDHHVIHVVEPDEAE